MKPLSRLAARVLLPRNRYEYTYYALPARLIGALIFAIGWWIVASVMKWWGMV